MSTYFSAESSNGASLRMYASHTHDSELTFEVTVGAVAFRVPLDEALATRLAFAMNSWYDNPDTRVATDEDVAQPLTYRHLAALEGII